jgi:hypothetical protein
MRDLVQGRLDDEDAKVRMGALLILARRPQWGEAAAGRMQAILDGGTTPPERRHAFEALLVLGQPSFLDGVPRYAHDAAHELRVTLAFKATEVADARFAECLIGFLEGETESQFVFVTALNHLFRMAHKPVGLPPALARLRTEDKDAFSEHIATLFGSGQVTVMDGEAVTLTRRALAESWFRWWAERLGLDEERTERAVEARRAFWAAKDRRDAAAAREALDDLGFDAPGLFCYERGWLQAQ